MERHSPDVSHVTPDERVDRNVQVVSIVGTVRTGSRLDFDLLASALGSGFSQKFIRFALYRPAYADSKVVFYRSGTLTFAGERSLEGLHTVKERVLQELRDAGYSVGTNLELTVGNIVGGVDLKVSVDLPRLRNAFPDSVEYEPEVFPGAIIRFEGRRLTCLIFSSGRTILTGAKTLEELDEALELVVDLLQRHDGN